MLICMAMYMTFRLIHKFAILRNRIQLEKQLTEYKLVFLPISLMSFVPR